MRHDIYRYDGLWKWIKNDENEYFLDEVIFIFIIDSRYLK